MTPWSLPGSSVHGILQGRILEWVPIPFSRGPSRPRDRTQVSCIAGGSLLSEPTGTPVFVYTLNKCDAYPPFIPKRRVWQRKQKRNSGSFPPFSPALIFWTMPGPSLVLGRRGHRQNQRETKEMNLGLWFWRCWFKNHFDSWLYKNCPLRAYFHICDLPLQRAGP